MQQDKSRVNVRPDMAADQLMIKTKSMVDKRKMQKHAKRERHARDATRDTNVADTSPILQNADMVHSPVSSNG